MELTAGQWTRLKGRIDGMIQGFTASGKESVVSVSAGVLFQLILLAHPQIFWPLKVVIAFISLPAQMWLIAPGLPIREIQNLARFVIPPIPL